MIGVIKRCILPISNNVLQANSRLYNLTTLTSPPVRTIFTSQICLGKTRKRRKRHPFFWLTDQYNKIGKEYLTPENETFFKEFLKDKYSLEKSVTPLKAEPWSTNEQYSDTTRRTGVVGVKLGSYRMWLKNGQPIITTCLQVSDNHVVNYHSPEEFAKIARPVDKLRYANMGCIKVGADSKDPRLFTSEYNGLFKESGVMPKQKLTRFFITHDARIEPGTPLLASHFRPGMYVDIYGKTIDFGMVTLRFRYKLKLGRKTHGNTKNHNRIGSIGRGRKWCGPLKGKRMPGPYGGERKVVAGLKVWRVNTEQNLIYLQGLVPGEVGSYINIMDSNLYGKRPTVEAQPPFPTASLEENSKLDRELYDESVHKASDPSIIYEITEQEKKAAAMARRAGKAKTAQKRV